jgi:N4-(beta-N-acetylglucosaminyl)-L-asparaginase
MSVTRRDFLATTAMTTASLALQGQEKPGSPEKAPQPSGKRPVIICKVTGGPNMDRAYQMLKSGGDTLDAVLHVCKGQEDDPNDDTVGLGGLPNEEGVVELDSCCMHGPTRRAGSVGGVRNIKNVCLVAKTVMERTGHVMLVGEGAERFAVAEGFPRENLLTERSRKIWMLWKETMSDMDWWGPGLDSPEWKYPADAHKGPAADRWEQKLDHMREVATRLGIPEEEQMNAFRKVLRPPTGTIHVSVVNEKGEMSGATTTSGLAWKIPGRLGDSPIIGAGCYCDQDVGSAGATGSGEENIKVAGAHSIVENMRKGMSPKDAGLDVMERIARNYNHDWNKLRFIDMVYYILRKDGAYAGVSFWSRGPEGTRRHFAVHDGTRRAEETVAFKEGSGIDWPPGFSLPKPKAEAAR